MTDILKSKCSEGWSPKGRVKGFVIMMRGDNITVIDTVCQCVSLRSRRLDPVRTTLLGKFLDYSLSVVKGVVCLSKESGRTLYKFNWVTTTGALAHVN